MQGCNFRKQPRWRGLRFSLRTLFIATTMFALAAYWIAGVSGRARQQTRALATIAIGGAVEVTWDYEFDSDGQFIMDAEPPGPSWLRRLVGDDYFRTPVRVELEQLSDLEMSCLSVFDNLEYIENDHRSPVTDRGLKAIRNLTHLKELYLAGSNITGQGLKYLNGMADLEELNVSNTRVGDEGLVHLTGLNKLRWLDVDHTCVSDEGMRYIGKLRSLVHLSVKYTSVSDAGLKHLESLSNVEWIGLGGTNVSGMGVERLRLALPGCKISHLPPTRDGGKAESPFGGPVALPLIEYTTGL